jgi:hypothetical protein
MFTPLSPKWLEAASTRASFEWISLRPYRSLGDYSPTVRHSNLAVPGGLPDQRDE